MNESAAQLHFVVGSVQTLYFQSHSSLYKVALVRIEDTNTDYDEEEIVVTGTFGQLHEDTMYRFVGQIVHHVKYGQQFAATTYSQEQPTSERALVAYLASSKFSGVGEVLATRIVKKLGSEAIQRIVTNPECLKSVTGLTATVRQQLYETLKQSQGMDDIIIGLVQYGFTDKMAYLIFEQYHEETLTIVQQSPYCLVWDIDQVGFQKADAIAEQLGFAADHPERLQAGLVAALQQRLYTSGDTFAAQEHVLADAQTLLEQSRRFLIDELTLMAALEEAVQLKRIIVDHQRYSLPSLYYAEKGVATAIQRHRTMNRLYDADDLEDKIKQLEQRLGITYAPSQRLAIKSAVAAPVFVLTGGPGTGKTTVLNGLVTLFAQLHDISLAPEDVANNDAFPILLAAPTGRAAKRMKELTGLPASTLHRLLNIGITGEERQSDGYVAPLQGSLLIVDEMSMVDSWLFHWLWKAIPSNMQVVLVGDAHQLPSVGPGHVLHDLIVSNTVPVVTLTDIYRQTDGSSIVALAHDIANGRLPHSFTQNQADRSFFACDNDQVPHMVGQIVKKAIARGFTARTIQVLAPMYKGRSGIDALNALLQQLFNGHTHDRMQREVHYVDKLFRVRDKVLQLVNQPEHNVFNGDIGEIVAIFFARETEEKEDVLVINFDGEEVRYTRSDWHQITLAYCCSIHKAQGSEYELVILPLVPQYGRMLRRDLVYTAVTRSRRLLIMCGSPAAFQQAVEQEQRQRNTLLCSFLRDLLPPAAPLQNATLSDNHIQSQQVVTTTWTHTAIQEVSQTTHTTERPNEAPPLSEPYRLTPDNYEYIDPMIGMDGITPHA